MGVVFKAFDTELNRPVAIKLLAPYLAGNGPLGNDSLVKPEQPPRLSIRMWSQFITSRQIVNHHLS